MKWEKRKLNITPGVSRFQKVEKPATKYLMVRLNVDQVKAIKEYCSKYNITATDLVLTCIAEQFKSKNFEPTGTPIEDPNQMKITY